jgi:hypothetical protein
LIFYVLLRPVSSTLSLLAAFFGIVSTATFATSELFYFIASLAARTNVRDDDCPRRVAIAEGYCPAAVAGYIRLPLACTFILRECPDSCRPRACSCGVYYCG